MSALVTTLSTSFAPGNSGGSLSLSMFQSYVGQGWVALKLVDTVPTGVLQLFADVGTVQQYAQSAEQITASIELVVNVERIDVPYGESLQFLWSLDENGSFVSPTLALDSSGDFYTVSPKCSGVLRRSAHTRPFTILRYRPQATAIGLGFDIKYGVVAAVKDTRAALIQVEPLDSDDNAIEAYRITSEVLVNELGEWEKPDGWPDAPAYPGGLTPIPDAGAGVLVERIHEICVITSSVTTGVRRYLVRHAKPYQSSNTYQPVKSLRQGALGSMTQQQQILATEAIALRSSSPL